ncbi:MMPL family transporter [Nakamurella flava]|uniref:MMPL family transporter n=1 Tax=Nakamurella flava TaxID=2576308 RepID=UPI001F0D6D2C|nr:MMPL family transporter [Nakamurella flava]
MPQPPTPAHLTEGPPASAGAPSRPGPTSRRSAVLRAVGLLALVGVWLAIAGLGGPAVGKLSTVQSNDQETFLPVGAEAVQADKAAAAFDTTGALPAFVVFTSEGGAQATPEQLASWGGFAQQVAGLTVTDEATGTSLGTIADYLVAPEASGGAPSAVPLIPAQDGQAALAVVSLSSDKVTAINPTSGKNVVAPVVDTLRTAAADAVAGGQVSVAGPAGLIADLGTAFAGIDGLLLLVALGAVLLILFVVYRAVVLPFLVLFTSLSALAAAGGLVYLLADNGVLTLNGQSQGILFILVVGAATDYALLLVSRYREELTRVQSRFTAMGRAWRACVEPIAASAGTVIIGLLCLLLSDLNSNRSLGPIGALGIGASFVAALTLLPALLMAGRWLFWPRIPRVLADRGLRHLGRHQALSAHGPTVAEPADDADHPGRHEADEVTGTAGRDAAASSRGGRAAAAGRDAAAPSRGGVWARVAVLVARHPRRIWLITVAGLAVAFAFVTTLQASGTQQTDVFLTDVESVAGQDALAQHFPGGSGNPVVIIAPESATDQVVSAVAAVPGISGQPAAVTASGAPASAGNPQPAAVVDGRVQIQATLASTPDSPAAKDTVRAVRDAVHALPGVGDQVLVGGATAIQVDTVDTAERDLTVIIPAILLAVLLVLVLLLRSLVAALLLTVATVLSFGAALGVSALVFNHVFDFPGADPAVPLFSFVFLVALGVDYSIFLMTRAREEVAFFGPKEGVLRGLRVTGGVITSAGLVLAATFAALAVIPILFLAQIAFIVAFGVLLDTFIVRTLLVPALAVDLGWKTWWPIRPKPTKHQLEVRGEPLVKS